MLISKNGLPYSQEAEESVLMAILVKNELAKTLCLELLPEDFFDPIHQKIFYCMARLIGKNEDLDVITVGIEYEKCFNDNVLPYLHNLYDNFCSVANINAYSRIVRERAALRRLIGTAKDIQDMAISDIEMNASEKADKAIRLIQSVQQPAQFAQVQTLEQLLPDYLDELDRRLELEGNIDGLSTGFKALDNKLKGLKPGQLIVLGARPGAGKTALALNIAQHVAINQAKRVLFFSLEMSSNELLDRLIASTGNYLLQHMKSGEAVHFHGFGDTFERVKNAPLNLCDLPHMNLATIGAIARKQQYQSGLDLIVIDYLQLLGGENNKETPYEKASKISRAAKLLAKSLNVPVILLSQLSRENEKRADKRPIAADLRDSGSIEQDADIILFIYRDDMYNENSPNKGTAEIIINKGRNIETGTVHVAWRGAFSKFDNLQDGWQPSEKPDKNETVSSLSGRYKSNKSYNDGSYRRASQGF